MSDSPRRILTLMGPTASGKTELAMRLADEVKLAIVSVDSAMVYRGLNIGTAKPSRAALEEYPHALINVRDPNEAFSVENFCTLADARIKQAFEEGETPLLVGGSMMYFRAFRDGLADLPDADPTIRAELRTLAANQGVEAVHAELAKLDPEAARRINPHNLKRMERALELIRRCGMPLSELWQQRATPSATERHDCELIEFTTAEIERKTLHHRIETRLQSMFEAGFVDEVRGLQRYPGLQRTSLSMRTIGYREIWALLEEGESEATMFERVLAATRQLARKQLTWLRRWHSHQLREEGSIELMVDAVKRGPLQ